MTTAKALAGSPLLVLVGYPNVGKSAVFARLTGRYAVVSNYPGTTVEVNRATKIVAGESWAVMDTPGMHALLPATEEEAVGRALLLERRATRVLHVIDARNLEAQLPLTLQLLEAGFPVVVALNMMDEARAAGLAIDAQALAGELGVPVLPCTATTGEGLAELAVEVFRPAPDPAPKAVPYPPAVEEAVQALAARLPPDGGAAPRALALLLLQDDAAIRGRIEAGDPALASTCRPIAEGVERRLGSPLRLFVTLARRREASRLARAVVRESAVGRRPFAERLGEWLTHPVLGGVTAVLFLYFGIYQLVGNVGAGVIVDFLERRIFEAHLTPMLEGAVKGVIPWPVVQSLFVGEYGVLTLGLRYAVAVILPIVSVFFLVFAMVEDSGYLPRLAMFMDRILKQLGLSGRAVIPMVLGFGCGTMATMVTRTLPTRRERFLATLLIALAIPCSAQLGVIVGLLHESFAALSLWVAVLAGVFLLVGAVGARLVPGGRALFFMDLPPMRWPSPRNVWRKTVSRVKWYMEEVLPLFMLASVLIWAGEVTGVFPVVVSVIAVPLGWLGLPAEASPAFLFGFFRRDYGAAGLYDLASDGALTTAQLAVAAVTLTLFLPCIAQFLVMGRERGWRAAVGVAMTATGLAFSAGWAVSRALPWLGAGSW